MKLARWLCWIIGAWNVALCLRGDPFTVRLAVQGATATQWVTNQTTLIRRPTGARPVFHAKVDEPLKLQFRVTNAGEPALTDVVIHLYVVAEDQPNQPRVAELKPDRVILESALSTDFKTNGTAQGTLAFRVQRAGFYLVRVEGLGKETLGLDEPFAALDLEVTDRAAK